LNILFIYNKKAGKKFEPSIVDVISQLIPRETDFSFIDIREFDSSDTKQYDTLVAIGGDGTVNTVAKRAKAEAKTLGIIPKGSGDGLARFLGIPRDSKQALQLILQGNTMSIDTAEVANHFFINVAGAGFEAEVAHKFGAEGVRGLKGYAKTILKSFWGRQEQEVTLTLNGKKTRLPFFSLSIANGSQWGNDFEIASAADIQDGFLDIAIMRKPKWYEIFGLIAFLRSNKQENNRLFTYYKAAEVDLKRSGKFWHVDGEPVVLKNKKKVTLFHKSLNVIVAK
jgi:diacylglycerol kinase (ATP)